MALTFEARLMPLRSYVPWRSCGCGTVSCEILGISRLAVDEIRQTAWATVGASVMAKKSYSKVSAIRVSSRCGAGTVLRSVGKVQPLPASGLVRRANGASDRATDAGV